jgi:hypothetical protein
MLSALRWQDAMWPHSTPLDLIAHIAAMGSSISTQNQDQVHGLVGNVAPQNVQIVAVVKDIPIGMCLRRNRQLDLDILLVQFWQQCRGDAPV